ncbi:MAG: hypothetical protein AAFP08_11040 [Bacteroidota bacterium]
MKQFILFSLSAFALLSFSACISDDDGGAVFLLPNPNDLLLEVNWTQADADFDISMEGPGSAFEIDVTDSPALTVNSGSAPDVTVSSDVTAGPGTETIRFNNSAPDGMYSVTVDAFDITSGSASFVLETTSQTITRTFNQSL